MASPDELSSGLPAICRKAFIGGTEVVVMMPFILLNSKSQGFGLRCTKSFHRKSMRWMSQNLLRNCDMRV